MMLKKKMILFNNMHMEKIFKSKFQQLAIDLNIRIINKILNYM